MNDKIVLISITKEELSEIVREAVRAELANLIPQSNISSDEQDVLNALKDVKPLRYIKGKGGIIYAD